MKKVSRRAKVVKKTKSRKFLWWISFGFLAVALGGVFSFNYVNGQNPSNPSDTAVLGATTDTAPGIRNVQVVDRGCTSTDSKGRRNLYVSWYTVGKPPALQVGYYVGNNSAGNYFFSPLFSNGPKVTRVYIGGTSQTTITIYIGPYYGYLKTSGSLTQKRTFTYKPCPPQSAVKVYSSPS